MIEKYVEETIRTEQMTLSQLIWKFLRRQPNGYLERVLEFNPGLSVTQQFLTVGSKVRLPVVDIEDKPRPTSVIRIFD